MARSHHYQATVTWTGNRGTGTSGYKDYGRDHEVTAPGCAPIAGSADRTFHGDRDRWNPEMLLVAALSQCHLGHRTARQHDRGRVAPARAGQRPLLHRRLGQLPGPARAGGIGCP